MSEGGGGLTCWTERVLIEEAPLILERWEVAVRGRIGSLRGAEQPILLDHVGELLKALAAWVSGRPIAAALDLLARAHGIQRVSHGVLMTELVHEHRLLREILVVTLETAEGDAGGGVAAAEKRRQELARMHEGLDLAVASAVEKYSLVRADAVATLESRLRLAVEASGIGTWDYDALLGFFELDTRARELLGLGAAPPGPVHRNELFAQIEPSCVDRLTAELAGSVDELRLDVLVHETRSPVERWLRLDGRALRDEEGRSVRTLGTVVDMTEQRTLERTRDRFLAVLGHNLRSPLNAIAVAAHLLVDGPAHDTPVIAARMVRSARRMEALIRDLLDFTRAAVGTPLPVVARPTSIEAVCASVLEEVRSAHPRATLVYEPGGDPDGVWDGDRLEQVVANLLTNAIKYGCPGAPVLLRWRRESGGALVLEVHNEGPPIPAQLQPHVFEAFRMGAEEGDERQSSAGLGLYVVAQIVRAHAGEVAVASTEQDGTTFRVRLPQDGGP